MQFNIICLSLFALKYASTARILGVFPFPVISHYILASKLMKGLTEAGHDVTMISPYELKDLPKNGTYTEVILDGFDEQFKTHRNNFNLFESDLENQLAKRKKITDLLLWYTEKTLVHLNVKKLLQSGKTFDAVITEQFFNDGLKVFAHIYGCPLILLSTVGPTNWVNPTVGNPLPISYIPHIFLKDSTNGITFYNRAKNLLFFTIDYFFGMFYLFPENERIMHQAFPKSPPLYDLYTNVSLILLNSHTSLYPAMPIVPNMVEIGGYFIDPPKKLSKDLQEFLDSAKNGAIYFSMGSTLKSKDISEEKKRAILNVFGKLKQRVLWKFEADLPDKPSNVMIRKWFSQQDILAHPNVKLFITHGGLLSLMETTYHGVPVLIIPVFTDQHMNADRSITDGYGLKLAYNDPNFNEETLSTLVSELLKNPKYKENIQRRSKIYHDRPMKPIETAVYWVEYVIRHKGAEHLRVAGTKMPLYKYFMVDVIGVIIISIFLSLCVLKLVYVVLIHKIINFLKKQKAD